MPSIATEYMYNVGIDHTNTRKAAKSSPQIGRSRRPIYTKTCQTETMDGSRKTHLNSRNG